MYRVLRRVFKRILWCFYSVMFTGCELITLEVFLKHFSCSHWFIACILAIWDPEDGHKSNENMLKYKIMSLNIFASVHLLVFVWTQVCHNAQDGARKIETTKPRFLIVFFKFLVSVFFKLHMMCRKILFILDSFFILGIEFYIALIQIRFLLKLPVPRKRLIRPVVN